MLSKNLMAEEYETASKTFWTLFALSVLTEFSSFISCYVIQLMSYHHIFINTIHLVGRGGIGEKAG